MAPHDQDPTLEEALPREPTLEALLAEQVWLRRLSVALVGESDADDLTQDVVLLGLRNQPAASGPGLRAWLRTVARRLASRRGEQARARARVESQAAKAESSDAQSNQRLDLHQQLSHAIRELPPPYRTALVMRYFEGLPPREIAERLQVPVTTARKRVSRGLALLREQLDGEFGERRAWAGPLAPIGMLASQSRSTPVQVAAATSVPLTLAGILSMKQVLAGVVILALCGLAVFVSSRALQRSPAHVALGGGARELQPPHTESAAVTDAASTAAVDALADGRIPVANTSAGPLLRIVGSDMSAVSNARVFWVDGQGTPHVIQLGSDASAPMPAESSRCRFYARADNYSTTVVRSDANGASLTLELEPTATLRGRIEVDGQAPRRPVTFTVGGLDEHLAHRGAKWRAFENTLQDLGMGEVSRVAKTRPDGTFEVAGLDAACSGFLLLPDSLRPRPKQTAEGQKLGMFKSVDEFVLVRVVQLPYVTGRLAWQSTGEPCDGGFWCVFDDGSNRQLEKVRHEVGSNGEFEIALPNLDSRAVATPLATQRLQITFPEEPTTNTIEIECASTQMPLDVGTLYLSRKPGTPIVVLGPSDTPLGGVTLNEYGRTYETGLDGTAEIPFRCSSIVASRSDLRTQRLVLPDLEIDSEMRRVIRMQPGVSLAIHADGLSAAPPDSILWIRARHQEPRGYLFMLMQLGRDDGKPPLVGGYHGLWADLQMPASTFPLRVDGFEPGRVLELELLDYLFQPIAKTSVEIPAGETDVEAHLVPNLSNLGGVIVRVEDPDGLAIDDARFEVLGREYKSLRVVPTMGRAVLAPLKPGTYRLRVTSPEHLPREIELEHIAGQTERTVVLQTGRELLLRYQDVEGYGFNPDDVWLETDAGWRSGPHQLDYQNGKHFRSLPNATITVIADFGDEILRDTIELGETNVILGIPTRLGGTR